MGSAEEAERVLKPIFDDFMQKWKEKDVDKVIEAYHPDAVIVEAGKKATYGKEEIKKELVEFLKAGNDIKIQEGHYQMSDDYIMYNGVFENTLQSGVVKGKFTQIWRKVGDTYQLLRDEYSWNE